MRFGRFVECLNQLKRPQILKRERKISRKVCEIVPGTSLGILMVISFSTQTYKLTVKMQRQRKPVVPLSPYSVENPPSIGETLNNRKLTTEASITEVVLIICFSVSDDSSNQPSSEQWLLKRVTLQHPSNNYRLSIAMWRQIQAIGNQNLRNRSNQNENA